MGQVDRIIEELEALKVEHVALVAEMQNCDEKTAYNKLLEDENYILLKIYYKASELVNIAQIAQELNRVDF